MSIDSPLSTLKLDHLMIAAADWREVRQTYQNFGFKVTDLRRNAPMGGGDGSDGGSQLIMLHGFDKSIMNYLEISTTVPEKATPIMNRILQNDGPAMMVSFSNQIDEIEKQWGGAGLNTQRFDATFPVSGSLGGGTFSIVIIDPEQSPLQINAVFSSDRSAYHVEEWFNHENGALGWTDVYCSIPDIDFDRVNAFYAASHGFACNTHNAGYAVYRPGQVAVHLLSHSRQADYFSGCDYATQAHPVIAGYRIAVQSLDVLEALLCRNGVVYNREGNVVTISPKAACGSILQFTERLEN
jgi:hypothetical protein